MTTERFGAAIIGIAGSFAGAASRQEAIAGLMKSLPDDFTNGAYYVVTYEEGLSVLYKDVQADMNNGQIDMSDLLDRLGCILNGDYMAHVEIVSMKIEDCDDEDEKDSGRQW